MSASRTIAIALAGALLAACGSSSTDVAMDNMPDGSMTDGNMDDGSMDDGSMTDGGTTPEPLDIPDTMTVSESGALNAAWRRDFPVRRVSLPSDGTHVVSVTRTDGGGATVVAVVDGQTQSVDFSAEQLTDSTAGVSAGGYWWDVTTTYVSGESDPLPHLHYDLHYWGVWPHNMEDPANIDHEVAGYVVQGNQTAPANLPGGTATYTGNIGGDLWDYGDSEESPELLFTTHHRDFWGELTLQADLANGMISGEATNIWVQDTQEDGQEWREWPDTTAMQFAGGRIVDGRFVLGWTGSETDDDAADATSLRGFTGDMLGAFYGPAGEEAAGMLNGRRPATDTTDAQVIVGYFGADRQ